MKAEGIKLTRPSYRVTFGRGGWCGTPPITVSAKASINTVQTNWPDLQQVRRPAYTAGFNATAYQSNVQTQRVDNWDGVMYLLGR